MSGVAARWRPTSALVRAVLVSAPALLLAVAVGRPDLVVLVLPLAGYAVVAVLRRPRLLPRAETRVLHDTIREGEGTVSRTRIHQAEDVEHAVVALDHHRWWATRPAGGVVGAAARPGASRIDLDVPFTSLRWGRRTVGDGLVLATSSWAGHQWGPEEIFPLTLTTLPLPGRFDSRAPAPHPIGLVGTHPARRPGEGSELASIRPFAAGDRLRRVQWRVSLRTGTLHVTSTVAEEDSSVLLVVDSGIDLGTSEGVLGEASSLDVAVRAAGAVAEHHLSRGDRVGLRVLGSTSRNAVRTGSGRRHLRQVLDTLARIVPGELHDVDVTRLRFRVPAGAVVLIFTPMLSERAVTATTTLAASGLSVVVVDTLPPGVRLGEDARAALAWRMRRLERRNLLLRLERSGVPVVPWRGPGTLDEVLVRLARRAARPRLAQR